MTSTSRSLGAGPPKAGSDVATLREQQGVLREHARLHWFHWLIVGLSVAITLFAWHTSKSLFEQRSRQRFEVETERVISLMQERLRHYEDALLSGVAAVQATEGGMTREKWRVYSEFLSLTGRYPGISGIGLIDYVEPDELADYVARRRLEKPDFTVHPPHESGVHLPITFVEPEGRNAAAVGLDVAFETHRRTAALRARSLGTTQISGPIVLVQDAGKTPGFLFYAPYYKRDGEMLPFSADRTRFREAMFKGMVYAPLVVKELVAGVLGREHREIAFTIRDEEEIIYEELDGTDVTDASFTLQRSVPLYGRTWTFDVRSTASLGDQAGFDESTVVLVCGLTIDAMLLALFALMARSSRRVLSLAEDMTNDLSAQASALAENNRDLESFAHVVSHDLKTPIRGIQDLTSFLREDLEDYLGSKESNPDVALSLDRLSQQATKSNTLISGILDYSLVGTEDERQSLVDTRELVEEVGTTLRLAPGQLVLEGDFPVLVTREVRLGQVFANRIGNAFKYHHSPTDAVTRVSVERRGDYYRFSIADNGPGIDPRFHARIFQAFTTLETSQSIDSSGIGLSIVKKSVEMLGGQVEIDSLPGHGTTFHFDWPVADGEALDRRSA